MPKALIFDSATLCSDGSIGIRWLKQFIDPDTSELLFSEPHRTMIDIDGDVSSQLDAVRADPQLKGYEFDVPKMKALVRKIDNIGKADPDIKAKRALRIAERQAALAAKAAEPG